LLQRSIVSLLRRDRACYVGESARATSRFSDPRCAIVKEGQKALAWNGRGAAPPRCAPVAEHPRRSGVESSFHLWSLAVAPRATWKGYVKLAELAFPVALYAGATTAKRVSFHILNRKTGNRVHRQYIDEETEKPVERDQQVKGYETGEDQYVILQPDEVAEVVPESDKTIRIEAFIDCPQVDTVYFDRPYFLAPPDGVLGESFTVLREGMRRRKVAALARAVLFRRVRTLLLRAQGPGLVANTLNFDYEVRDAAEVFEDLPDMKIKGEMLDLAKHIIETKAGDFDPRSFDDRYDQALAGLVKAKMEGLEIKPPKRPKETKVVNLMDALRRSAEASGKTTRKASKKATKKARPEKRKKAAPERRRKAG
jgi:DNA end-binding protein Ku